MEKGVGLVLTPAPLRGMAGVPVLGPPFLVQRMRMGRLTRPARHLTAGVMPGTYGGADRRHECLQSEATRPADQTEQTMRPFLAALILAASLSMPSASSAEAGFFTSVAKGAVSNAIRHTKCKLKRTC